MSFTDVTNRGTLHATGALTVTGTLTNSGSLDYPTTLAGGAYLDNTATGVISVTGTRAIVGIGIGIGVSVANAGTIQNNFGGRLTYNVGIELADGGTVTNYGTISGGADAVVPSAGGTVTNNGTAALIEGATGVYLAGAGSVVNTGTIKGTGAGVALGTGDELINGTAGGPVPTAPPTPPRHASPENTPSMHRARRPRRSQITA